MPPNPSESSKLEASAAKKSFLKQWNAAVVAEHDRDWGGAIAVYSRLLTTAQQPWGWGSG